MQKYQLPKLLVGLSMICASVSQAYQCHELLNQPIAEEKLGLAKKLMAEANRLNPTEMEFQFVRNRNPLADTIVFVHGLGSSMHTFYPLVNRLSSQYNVLIYSQRGHGRTVARGEDYSTHQMAADLKGLVDHIGISRFHIYGHSLGARVAMRFLDFYPEHVKSITLEDMDMRKRQSDEPAKLERHKKIAAAVAKLRPRYESIEALVTDLAPAFDGDFEKAARYLRFIAEPIHPESNEWFVFPRAEILSRFGFQGNVDDFGSVVKNAKVRMLFLRANPKRSPFFDDEGLQHLQAHHNGQTHVMIYPFAGHTIHDEKTVNDMTKDLQQFIRLGLPDWSRIKP